MAPWSPWGWVRRGWLSAYGGDSDGALRELHITLPHPASFVSRLGDGLAMAGVRRA
jgi:hypothetical protein